MKRYNACLNCEDRCVGCHANCSKYLEYKAYLDVIKKNKAKATSFYKGLVVKRRAI